MWGGISHRQGLQYCQASNLMLLSMGAVESLYVLKCGSSSACERRSKSKPPFQSEPFLSWVPFEGYRSAHIDVGSTLDQLIIAISLVHRAIEIHMEQRARGFLNNLWKDWKTSPGIQHTALAWQQSRLVASTFQRLFNVAVDVDVTATLNNRKSVFAVNSKQIIAISQHWLMAGLFTVSAFYELTRARRSGQIFKKIRWDMPFAFLFRRPHGELLPVKSIVCPALPSFTALGQSYCTWGGTVVPPTQCYLGYVLLAGGGTDGVCWTSPVKALLEHQWCANVGYRSSKGTQRWFSA